MIELPTWATSAVFTLQTRTDSCLPPAKDWNICCAKEGREAEGQWVGDGAGVQTKAGRLESSHTTPLPPASTTSEFFNTLKSSNMTFRKLNRELLLYTSLPKLKTPGGQQFSFINLCTSSNTQPGPSWSQMRNKGIFPPPGSLTDE